MPNLSQDADIPKPMMDILSVTPLPATLMSSHQLRQIATKLLQIAEILESENTTTPPPPATSTFLFGKVSKKKKVPR